MYVRVCVCVYGVCVGQRWYVHVCVCECVCMVCVLGGGGVCMCVCVRCCVLCTRYYRSVMYWVLGLSYIVLGHWY